MGFDLLLLIVGIVAIVGFQRRIGRLEREVGDLRDRLKQAAPTTVATVPPTAVASAAVAQTGVDDQTDIAPEPSAIDPLVAEPVAELESPRVRPPERPGLESLIGGKLPIWVGGAALVFSGFFLVRYSIESGLIGPGVRVALAALFSIALIAASEVARRAGATRSDPRVAQVLAGAGVASAYGTLYVAAAQYHLVGPAAGFALMIAITAIALFLALRHGPPTAIMALIGGFAAPLVAGFDAAGLGPLLVYLALFVAALFGLAVKRGWSWLALAAVVAGFGWANLLLMLVEGRELAGVAGFVVALAIGATLALPATGEARRLLRVAPLVAGLVQLLVLAPSLSFDATAWSFFIVLSAAALLLAWRDATLLGGAVAAACLTVVLIAAALIQPETAVTRLAAIAATLLFGGVGAALSRRAQGWATVALIGLAGPVLAAHAIAPALLAKPAWTLVELILAAGCVMMAWRHRDRAGVADVGLVGGAAGGALLAGVGVATLAGADWAPTAIVPVLIALGFGSRHIDDARLARLPAFALVAMLLLAGETLAGLASTVAGSLAGDRLPYRMLPAAGDVARHLVGPTLAGGALLLLPRAYGRDRRWVGPLLAMLGVALIYVAAKLPLAIATPEAFLHWGFAERGAITLLALAAGWTLARRTRFGRTGAILVGLALFRLVWFDLIALNPAFVAQEVGAVPLANMAVLLPAAIAAATATMGGAWRRVALFAGAVAVAAMVRQIAHGTILTGPLGNAENWGYSAAFLVLAMGWLGYGMARGDRLLRVAGLGLLTLVTLKVFLVDVAALGGVLRILSFLGLGIALIGIGWAYGRVVAPRPATPVPDGQPSR